MTSIKHIVMVAVVCGAFFSCKNNKQPEVKTVAVEYTEEKTENTLDPNATYAKVEFGIDGMTCAMGCAATIEKKMAKMDGVKSAKVDFDKELAMVEYDEAKVSPESLEEAVAAVGDAYTVKDMKEVDSFSDEKKACSADCKMECCKDKDKMKAQGDKKMACSEDCKKACCEKKA